jgi:hypothetical protein
VQCVLVSTGGLESRTLHQWCRYRHTCKRREEKPAQDPSLDTRVSSRSGSPSVSQSGASDVPSQAWTLPSPPTQPCPGSAPRGGARPAAVLIGRSRSWRSKAYCVDIGSLVAVSSNAALQSAPQCRLIIRLRLPSLHGRESGSPHLNWPRREKRGGAAAQPSPCGAWH